MKRNEEIRELQCSIHDRKQFNPAKWCEGFCIPSASPNWYYIIISGGDVVDRVKCLCAKRKLMVIDIDNVPHTVVKVRVGLVDALRRAKNLRSFYGCLSKIIAPEDLKTYHNGLWVAANNLNANIKRIQELQKRTSAPRDGIGREVCGIFSNNTVRDAAKHYGCL